MRSLVSASATRRLTRSALKGVGRFNERPALLDQAADSWSARLRAARYVAHEATHAPFNVPDEYLRANVRTQS